MGSSINSNLLRWNQWMIPSSCMLQLACAASQGLRTSWMDLQHLTLSERCCFNVRLFLSIPNGLRARLHLHTYQIWRYLGFHFATVIVCKGFHLRAVENDSRVIAGSLVDLRCAGIIHKLGNQAQMKCQMLRLWCWPHKRKNTSEPSLRRTHCNTNTSNR